MRGTAVPAGHGGSADGFINGEPLANDHPVIHGEPPVDGTTLGAYVGDLSTAKRRGKHPDLHTDTVEAICCD